jgi:integrase
VAIAPAPIPNLAAIKSLVLNAVSSPNTRRAYDIALTAFLNWYREQCAPGFQKSTVHEYRLALERQGMSASSINVHLSAVRKLAVEASDNGLLPGELAAGIARVRGPRRQGTRSGNWLTPQQTRVLLSAPDPTTRIGLRDRAILALLAGCGLRRAELVSLDTRHIQMRDARWVILDLEGKGSRLRTVPVPAWVKHILDEWMRAAGIESGPVFRPMNKSGTVLDGRISDDTVWNVVRQYGAQIDQPELRPHDLRRTCAKLCRASGGDLEQIQFLLGHASIQTTERYLGTRQNLAQAVNDNLPIGIDL